MEGFKSPLSPFTTSASSEDVGKTKDGVGAALSLMLGAIEGGFSSRGAIVVDEGEFDPFCRCPFREGGEEVERTPWAFLALSA